MVTYMLETEPWAHSEGSRLEGGGLCFSLGTAFLPAGSWLWCELQGTGADCLILPSSLHTCRTPLWHSISTRAL